MNYILISTLISLLTLAILLFNKTKPFTLQIPSWFIGGKQLVSPRRLRLTKPPWVLWLCVIFATIGAAIAYWPSSREGRANIASKNALIWIDDTLSAKISMLDKKFSIGDIVSQMSDPRLNLFIIESQITANNGYPQTNYLLRKLSNALEVKSIINKVQNVSPFSRSLITESLALKISQDANFSNGKGILFIVSDGQRNTLSNLSPLKNLFASIQYISLPEAISLQGDKHELIPSELLEAWHGENKNTAQNFLEVDSEVVPVFARPHIFLESFFEATKFITQGQKQSAELPLITICRESVSGSIENDPQGELRELLNFLGGMFRFDNCVEESHSPLPFEQQPWKFRPASIWVVPVDAEIAATLALQKLWIPKGFSRESDALVYVASIRTSATSGNLVTEAAVQFEANAAPLVLFLAPLPTNFVYSFNYNSGNSDNNISQAFTPIIKAVDNTPLAYQLPKLPVFFLRTPLSSPNGELTRMAWWMKFWLQVSATTNAGSTGFKIVNIADTSEFITELKRQNINNIFDFSLRLQESTLQYMPYKWEENNILSGIYSNPKTFDNLFLSISNEERTLDFMSKTEIENAFLSQEATAITEQEKVQKEKRILPFIGAVIAFLSLMVLWLYKRDAAVVVIFLLTCIYPNAFGQVNLNRFVNAQAVPFRIAWCNLEAQPRIIARYQQLRSTLAERGTIRLPKELLLGQCKVGMADIFWTDNYNSLPEDLDSHLAGGGFFLLEGVDAKPPALDKLAIPSLGQFWESPQKRGMLFRSFYLTSSFDGCLQEKTQLLRLRKKVNAMVPQGIVTSVRFLSAGEDCFGNNEDYRTRSFVNLMYAILTTDYKEDHLQIPEILGRIRSLGLEP